MDDKTYKMTLADGTEISNLSLNGNNFISTEAIDESIFEDNCSPVIINDGETDEVYNNMELVRLMRHGDDYWFVLRDITNKEIAERQLRADVEYIAMVCGVEL